MYPYPDTPLYKFQQPSRAQRSDGSLAVTGHTKESVCCADRFMAASPLTLMIPEYKNPHPMQKNQGTRPQDGEGVALLPYGFYSHTLIRGQSYCPPSVTSWVSRPTGKASSVGHEGRVPAGRKENPAWTVRDHPFSSNCNINIISSINIQVRNMN